MQCCLQRPRESDWRKQSHRWPGPVRDGVCASGGVFPWFYASARAISPSPKILRPVLSTT